METDKKPKLSKTGKIVVIVISIIVIAMLAAASYTYALLSSMKRTDISNTPDISSAPETEPETPENIEGQAPEVREQEPVEEPPKKEEGVVNIALFGLDGNENERNRTDTIMILTVDKSSKKIKLTSLMRDMYVSIPKIGRNRINAAYAFGGPGLAINTINKNFDMDIKYYASVNFKSVQSVVDKLGGVDVYVKKGEIPPINSNSKSHISGEGMHHLDGEQALSYMRIRHYGDGEYERTLRQRVVLSQLYEKTKKAGVLKLPGLLSTILPYMETNMPNSDIMLLSASAIGYDSSVEQYRIPADGTFDTRIINGRWVIAADMRENAKLLHRFIYGMDK